MPKLSLLYHHIANIKNRIPSPILGPPNKSSSVFLSIRRQGLRVDVVAQFWWLPLWLQHLLSMIWQQSISLDGKEGHMITSLMKRLLPILQQIFPNPLRNNPISIKNTKISIRKRNPSTKDSINLQKNKIKNSLSYLPLIIVKMLLVRKENFRTLLPNRESVANINSHPILIKTKLLCMRHTIIQSLTPTLGSLKFNIKTIFHLNKDEDLFLVNRNWVISW